MGLVKQEILRVFRTIPPNFSATDFNSEVPITSCCVVTLFLVNDDSGFTVYPQYDPPHPEEMVSVAVPEKYWFEVRYRDKTGVRNGAQGSCRKNSNMALCVIVRTWFLRSNVESCIESCKSVIHAWVSSSLTKLRPSIY